MFARDNKKCLPHYVDEYLEDTLTESYKTCKDKLSPKT